MKTIIITLAGIALCILSACLQSGKLSNVETIVLVDATDTLHSPVNAEDIMSRFNLRQNPWRGVTATVSSVTDMDNNYSKTIHLEAESRALGNKPTRNARVKGFEKELVSALDIASGSGSLDHSIIYRCLARSLNKLRTSEAEQRSLLVFGDLMEHAEVDFYNPETFERMESGPMGVLRELENAGKIESIRGIEVLLVFKPKSYQENAKYRKVSNFYKAILEKKGAKVEIVQSVGL